MTFEEARSIAVEIDALLKKEIPTARATLLMTDDREVTALGAKDPSTGSRFAVKVKDGAPNNSQTIAKALIAGLREHHTNGFQLIETP